MYESIDKLINKVKDNFKDDKKIGEMFEKWVMRCGSGKKDGFLDP